MSWRRLLPSLPGGRGVTRTAAVAQARLLDAELEVAGNAEEPVSAFTDWLIENRPPSS